MLLCKSSYEHSPVSASGIYMYYIINGYKAILYTARYNRHSHVTTLEECTGITLRHVLSGVSSGIYVIVARP